MAKRDAGSASSKSRAGMVVDTVGDVIVDAAGAVTPLSKSAAKELRKLEKRLASARKTETKRAQQLAAALGSKGRKQVAKRQKQLAAAEADVAGLAAKLAAAASSAAGSAASSVGGVASSVGGALGGAASSVGGAVGGAASSAGGAVAGAARTVGGAALQASQAVSPARGTSGAGATAGTKRTTTRTAKTRRRTTTARRRTTAKPAASGTGTAASADTVRRSPPRPSPRRRSRPRRPASPQRPRSPHRPARPRRPRRLRRQRPRRPRPNPARPSRPRPSRPRPSRQVRRSRSRPSDQVARGGCPEAACDQIDRQAPDDPTARRTSCCTAGRRRQRDQLRRSRTDTRSCQPTRGQPSALPSTSARTRSICWSRASPATGSSSLVDESVFLGLGAAVAERGYLGRPARAELAATLARLRRDRPRPRGRDRSPSWAPSRSVARRTPPAIVHEVEAAAATPLHVLSHEEEAYPHGHRRDRGPAGHPRDPRRRHRWRQHRVLRRRTPAIGRGRSACGSARPGSAVASSQHDPPTSAELDAMRWLAADALPRALPTPRPVEIVAVGGTASNLLKVLPDAAARPAPDPGAHRRGRRRSWRMEPSAAAAERHGSTRSGPASCRPGRRSSMRILRALRRRDDPRLGGRDPRGGRAGGHACRPGLARPAGGARARLAHVTHRGRGR